MELPKLLISLPHWEPISSLFKTRLNVQVIWHLLSD